MNLKIPVVVLLALVSSGAWSDVYCQQRSNGDCDYTKPKVEVKNGEMYYLRNDGSRDYTRKAIKTDKLATKYNTFKANSSSSRKKRK